MKILHCADMHLDSKLEANLSREQAKERKAEILGTFVNMVAYAEQNNISIILISGDLFDKNNISATARNTVLNSITDNPDITFYYLKGNHDSDGFLASLNSVPENLKLFSDNWTTYVECEESLAITGMELNSPLTAPVLDNSRFNIVMLHGQESEAEVKDHSEIINLKVLRNKGIDYLALGHVHSFKFERLDSRGCYCYPGCLEGRGFDECGEHGFVVLDIDTESGRYTTEFVPFAKRRLFNVCVDVSGCTTTAEMLNAVKAAADEQGCDARDLVKIVLCGNLDVECEKNTDYILSSVREQYYFTKIYDETKLRVEAEDYRFDTSLKGEFVRSVLNDDSLSEEDRAAVIRYGIQILMGEAVN